MRNLLTTTLMVGLVVVSGFQTNTIYTYKNTIANQEMEIHKLKNYVDEQITDIEELTKANHLLELEIDVLNDSIQLLQYDLTALSEKVTKSKKSLKAVQEELDIRQKELQFLKSEVKKSKSNSKKYAQKEEMLLKRVSELEGQVESLEVMENETAQDVQQVEAESDEKELIALKMVQLKNIMENTIVDYQSVSLRKTKKGESISRLKSNGRNWKYTVVKFDLHHIDPTLILDGEFEWRIYDLNSGQPISFIEANPSYPTSDNDNKGCGFQFSGTATETTFINTQEKSGTNFELRLFYVEDGKSYLISGSSRPIILERNII